MDSPDFSRRAFLQTATLALGSAAVASAQTAKPKIKVGYDNFAVRAMGWKAPELLDFAVKLKCDTLFISDLDAFGSLDDAALRDVKKRADNVGIALYAGGWSICPTSKSWGRDKRNWKSGEEHLETGIRVARTVGSPVYRVVLGSADDRKTEGGIKARIADTVKVLKNCRQQALDAGVKVSVENHAGDMHSWELKTLIEDAGADFVGVNFDSGNAAWTLEDPLDAFETLAQYVNCSSLRDDMIWATDDGASVQWTAVGEGLLDWKKFTARWAEVCPNVPIQIETISGFARNFAYKKDDFWTNYDRKPEAFAKFEALASKGHKIESFKAPDGVDRKKAEQEFQRGDLERSIKYLRETLGIGLKA
ncbi:MAG TPA: sugar phosphate isomerase/epimerase [Chthoniobacteraceae bacterium]|nr:sugar phosphate isomerase/epimerase [Chthoniobacteraceae bacterium]